jgi:hypothetical protein
MFRVQIQYNVNHVTNNVSFELDWQKVYYQSELFPMARLMHSSVALMDHLLVIIGGEAYK